MTVIDATIETFDTLVANNAAPVLVDFWAPWCGPCRAMSPALDDVAADFAGTAHVVKVDIEANPAIAERFGISTVPTLMMFRKGEEVSRTVGAQTRLRLSAMIEGALP